MFKLFSLVSIYNMTSQNNSKKDNDGWITVKSRNKKKKKTDKPKKKKVNPTNNRVVMEKQYRKPLLNEPKKTSIPKLYINPDDDMVRKPKKQISYNFKKALMNARIAKKMSQKDLAHKINVKPYIIAQYEQGSISPNYNVIHKIQNALQCKLPKLQKV